MQIKLIVSVKHFVRYDEWGNILKPSEIRYDYDEDMIFTYDVNNHVLGIIGSGWKKPCEPDSVVDTIVQYFKGTCYHIADIQKMND